MPGPQAAEAEIVAVGLRIPTVLAAVVLSALPGGVARAANPAGVHKRRASAPAALSSPLPPCRYRGPIPFLHVLGHWDCTIRNEYRRLAAYTAISRAGTVSLGARNHLAIAMISTVGAILPSNDAGVLSSTFLSGDGRAQYSCARSAMLSFVRDQASITLAAAQVRAFGAMVYWVAAKRLDAAMTATDLAEAWHAGSSWLAKLEELAGFHPLSQAFDDLVNGTAGMALRLQAYNAVVAIGSCIDSSSGPSSGTSATGSGGSSPGTTNPSSPGSGNPARQALTFSTPMQLTLGQPASWSLITSNPSGEPLSLVATGFPPGLNFDGATGLVSGTPSRAGTYDFKVVVLAPAQYRGSSFRGSIAVTQP